MHSNRTVLIGTVLLKTSAEIMADIEGCGESVGYENIERLLQEAGIDPALTRN